MVQHMQACLNRYNIIADYLFNNKLEGIFSLPKANRQQLRLQGLQQAYTY